MLNKEVLVQEYLSAEINAGRAVTLTFGECDGIYEVVAEDWDAERTAWYCHSETLLSTTNRFEWLSMLHEFTQMSLYSRFLCVEDRAGCELCFRMEGEVNRRKPFFVEELEINDTAFLSDLLEEYELLSKLLERHKKLCAFFPKVTEKDVIKSMTDASDRELLMSILNLKERE